MPRKRGSSENAASLSFTDIEVGRVLWLPPRDRVEFSLSKYGLNCGEPVVNITHPNLCPNEGFYNHPVLVLSGLDGKSNNIHFLLLTTFHGQDISTRFQNPWGRARMAGYLAIATSTPHPLSLCGYQTLHPSIGVSYMKPGYLNISDVYSVDWRVCEHFWGGKKPRVARVVFSNSNMESILSHTRQRSGYKLSPQRVYDMPPESDIGVPRAQVMSPPTVTAITGQTLKRADSAIAILPSTQTRISSERFVDGQPSHPVLSTASWLPYIDERQPLLSQYDPQPGDGRGDANCFFARLWDYLQRTRLGIIVRYIFCF